MHAGEASRGSFAVMDDIEQMERDQTERAARPLRVDRLGAAALLAFAAAFLVNLVIRWLGQAVLGVAEDEELLSTLSIALTTLFGAGAGAVGLYVLAAQAARPLLAFRRLAVLALALSLLGPLSAVLGWVPQSQSVDAATFVTLVLMHLATMAIIVLVLTAAARSSLQDRRRAGRAEPTTPGRAA